MWFLYIVISVLMFFVGKNCENGSIGKGILFAATWPLALAFIIISLFWGAGRYL